MTVNGEASIMMLNAVAIYDAHNHGPLAVCMGKSENQKAKNTNENDLHKNHQKHNEPLLVIRVDEEDDDVEDLNGSTRPVYGAHQSAVGLDHW